MQETSKRKIPQCAPVRLAAGVALAAATLSGPAMAAEEESKVQYDFYGFVQLDAIYDFDRMNPDWKDMLRPSQIPIDCPGDPGCGTDGETILSVRQTRAGVNVLVPTDLGDMKAKLEFELVGVGSDAGKTTPRLRHAYGEIGPFLVGQTWSTFMDIDTFPNTIEYWGPPSMIFWRNIQLRWTPYRTGDSEFAIAFESPSSAVDDGKLSGIAPELDIQGKTEYPDLTAHWRTQGDWGHLQVAGLLRSVGYENASSPDGEPSGSETGYGANLSGSLKVGPSGTIKAAVAWGEAIASYFNDGGIDLAPSGDFQAETLPILGWFAFYDHSWNKKWSSSLGWAGTEQDNSDGQTDSAFKANSYGLVNLLHYPTNNIMVGGELQYGEYEQKGGKTADDTRVQFSFKYMF